MRATPPPLVSSRHPDMGWQTRLDDVGTTRENPFTLAHWVGRYDPRLLALLRIFLGGVLLQDLYARAWDLTAFLSDDGILPVSLLPSSGGFSVFKLVHSPVAVAWVFAAGVVATLCFTLGAFTRFATLLTWGFFVSLHNRFPPIHHGGDSLVDALLLLSLFTDPAAAWSIDALRRRGPRYVHALVPRLMGYVPAALYLFTARAKLREGGLEAWLHGPVIFQHLQLHGWVRPGGVWLARHETLCRLVADATIVIELAVPVLLVLPFWIRPARLLAIALHIGLQLGILLTLKVGVFTYVMFSVTWLWVPGSWLNRAARYVPLSPLEDAPSEAWHSGHLLAHAPLAFVYALFLASPVIPRHLPNFTGIILGSLSLQLTTGLFTHGLPSERWVADGWLDSGAHVDPLAKVAPSLESNVFFNSPWVQLPRRLKHFDHLGRYVCSEYNEGAGPRLRTWRLTHLQRDPYLPGASPPDEVSNVVLEATCSR